MRCVHLTAVRATGTTGVGLVVRAETHPTHSILADPQLVDMWASVPEGMRPREGSPLLGSGIDVGLTMDFGGANVPPSRPSIGAFQEPALGTTDEAWDSFLA